MGQDTLFLGVLEKNGSFSIGSQKLLLAKISQEVSESPESALVEISNDNIGKMTLVRGVRSGDVIYSAEIVEVLSPATAIVFRKLIEKGVLALGRIEETTSGLKAIETQLQETKKLCALVIGHKKYSPGAVNEKLGISEFDFNDDLAMLIEKKVEVTDIQRVYRRTYQKLPGDINALAPDFVVSLHCNAFNGTASGTEVLYYHKSTKGKKMAEILLKHLVEFLELPNRGIKAKTAEDRGGYLLRYTSAPCVIAEPFFIDNDKDLARALSDRDGLAETYARAIDKISQIGV